MTTLNKSNEENAHEQSEEQDESPNIKELTMKVLEKVISTLKNGKAVGHCGIKAKMIRYMSPTDGQETTT